MYLISNNIQPPECSSTTLDYRLLTGTRRVSSRKDGTTASTTVELESSSEAEGESREC